jgi:hypothetical protein
MGLLRIWTPFAAIALERYSSRFGRKMLLIGSQGQYYESGFTSKNSIPNESVDGFFQ